MIYTIGHSTRPLLDFFSMLRENRVYTVVDIRSLPWSKQCPQYHIDNMMESLPPAGFDYMHLPGLGGLRVAHKNRSTNLGWHNRSFRGYADYMQNSMFWDNLDRLIEEARKHQVVIMCAESDPGRCHRSLVSDALMTQGAKMFNILGPSKIEPARMTPFAKVTRHGITYPEAQLSFKEPA